MKRKLLTALTGIALSMAIVVTGCAVNTGTTSTASSDAGSSPGQAQAQEQQTQPKEEDHTEVPDREGKGDHSGKKPKNKDSETAAAELKTVEPADYAGQTICGKVTSISGSEVTVTLGTYDKTGKESGLTNTSLESGTAENGMAKKKKSSFTAGTEQMTITIPDSLSSVEIKEKYVLSVTLDDEGNVTELEVLSKGRHRPEQTEPNTNTDSNA